jgi:3-phenylpropionate/trans-cinnamate dioxygenase ferredoxin reductase component
MPPSMLPGRCRDGRGGAVAADVMIIGNGVAGHACASRLAQSGLRPLLIGPGLPFDRPPLTKAALASGEPRPLADAVRLAEKGIDVLDGYVSDVDLDRRVATVIAEGETTEVSANTIVYAVGLAYLPPPVRGLEDAHVNATPAGLRRLAPELAGDSKRVLVVGGGLIGVESAATLASSGHAVTVVDMVERPLDRLHDPLSALGLAALDQLGVRFIGGVRIEAAELSDDGRTAVVQTSDHGRLEADLVIAATGGRPVPLPGLPHATVPIEVDAAMRLPDHHSVYVIGDCVAPPHARFGRLYFPHWAAAIATADLAAGAIAGDVAEYDALPYWWSDIGPLRVAEFGVASLVAEWNDEDGLLVGRDADDNVACVCVIGGPKRMREARALFGP